VAAAADPGLRLNEFNTVVGFADDAPSRGILQLGDVLTEVNGRSVAGEEVDWELLRFVDPIAEAEARAIDESSKSAASTANSSAKAPRTAPVPRTATAKAAAARGQKHFVIKLIRQRGAVPLRAGVEVKPCHAAINRVNRDAAAFEVTNHAEAGGKKARYVFICPTEQEASEWQERIRLAVCQVPPWVESALPSSRV